MNCVANLETYVLLRGIFSSLYPLYKVVDGAHVVITRWSHALILLTHIYDHTSIYITIFAMQTLCDFKVYSVPWI